MSASLDDARAADAGDGSVSPRDISYGPSAKTAAGEQMIRLVENLTGRIAILLRLNGFDKDVAAGEDLFECLWRRFRLALAAPESDLARIPSAGPSIIVANHPFGLLDALTLCVLLRRRRRDFKVLANAVFANAPELGEVILPVDFSETREAQRVNIATRKAALAQLAAGGCVALFPAGAVASSPRAFAPAYDVAWKTFAARLAIKSGAPTTPILFDGDNSRLFHAIGYLHPTLRLGLYLREFNRAVGRPVSVRVGPAIAAADLPHGDPQAATRALRNAVYALRSPPEADPPVGKPW